MSKEAIGCCGAYCATCKVFKQKACKGCKLGYKDCSRDITKVRCAIKKCCLQKKYTSCADCNRYNACETIQSFHNKESYKYKKYKEAVLYIRDHGYQKFLSIAGTWKMQYGKYDK